MLFHTNRNIFVTTLDGQLTTLDLIGGRKRWSIATEPGELLSSSIHRLELTSNGKYVRMIPSLSGGIYKFDGESIEPIPVTAEDLLKSSFKFSDDTVISGGTEVRTYGVNTRTGRMLYEYSMAGGRQQNLSDQQLDEEPQDEESMFDDTLILKRHSQTVRAIEPRTGEMRWNFSIGHHELELMSNHECEGSYKDELDELLYDIDLRVIVPEGIVCAYDRKEPSSVLWKQKLDSPVVSVFRLNPKSRRLESIDMFKNVNWMWKGTNYKPSIDAEMSPSLYLGMYQQQLYIQESDLLHESIDHHKQLEHNLISDATSLPKIPFKPLPAGNKQILTTLENHHEFKDDGSLELNIKQDNEVAKIDNQLNAQSVLYASQYAEGKGFYFFTEKQINQSMQCKRRSTIVNTEEFDNVTFKNHGILARSSHLWDYWKEILVIALTTAFVVNFMLNTRKKENGIVYVTVPYAKEAMEFEEEERHKKEIEELKRVVEIKSRSLSESQTYDPYQHYVSRFLTDFDLIQCLGKGGFGVVFEAKNKLDDCHYAIKRILLPSKKESRDRVLREVKTLANCEHRNIVRYFHAWIEQPPQGWQETKDKELLSRDICSTSITIDSPSPTEESKNFLPPYVSQSNEPWKLNFNEFDSINSVPKRDLFTTDDSSSFIQFKAESDAGETTTEEETADHSKAAIDDESSFQIEFKESTKGSLTDMPSDTSHVISFRCTTDDESATNGHKKHRRNVSVDISELSELRAKRPTSLIPSNSSTKVYLYIQMQLCMKNSLKDWLMSNDLPKRDGATLNIWRQIIEAVHYVHLKGLIHRDLKPSNIFFALDGQIKIGDFGLVTDMAETPIDPQTSSSSNSNSSNNMEFDFTKVSGKEHTQRVGTSLYMSPEQGRGLAYNYKVDIYSLGLILFELLNYFGTESERIRTLESIRRQNFPAQFMEDHRDEVSFCGAIKVYFGYSHVTSLCSLSSFFSHASMNC